MAGKFIPYAELDDRQRALVDSEAMWDRHDAAGQGFGLDKLVDDKDWIVRCAVAEQGFGLEKLVDDPEEWAREAVAWQGYGLDKLAGDVNDSVRDAALESMGFNLERFIQEWADANPNKCALEENRTKKGEGRPEEEKGRKPGELKSVGDKPKQPACETATPGEDGKVCSASAAARGVEAPAKSSPEKKR